jgi:surfeit locus 1 family protein
VSRVETGLRRHGSVLLPSVTALIAFVVLIGLGTWQVERKAWKEGLIAALSARLAAAAVALPAAADWGRLDPASDEFLRVRLRAEFVPGGEGRVFASGSGLRDDIKSPGYFAFAPVRLSDGHLVVVNRGFVANSNPDASLRPLALPEGPVEIVGVLRWPEPPSHFVTSHDKRADLWFVRDQRLMAQDYGWGDVAPFYVEQEAPVPAGGVPKPGALKINLPNSHLQYAITWYGLAAALAVVFAVWLRARRRQISSSVR